MNLIWNLMFNLIAPILYWILYSNFAICSSSDWRYESSPGVDSRERGAVTDMIEHTCMCWPCLVPYISSDLGSNCDICMNEVKGSFNWQYTFAKLWTSP